MRLSLCRVRTAALGGSAGLFALAGCGDVLGFEHGAVVQCVENSDCGPGAVCNSDHECVAGCVESGCASGFACQNGRCVDVAIDNKGPSGDAAGPDVAVTDADSAEADVADMEADSAESNAADADADSATCAATCTSPSLCLDSICKQGAAGAPYANSADTAYQIQPNTITCSEVDISVCEWISGIGIDFFDPPAAGTFRLGVYEDTKDYPTKLLAQTASISPGGSSTLAGLTSAPAVNCGDSGAPFTPIWLCVMTTVQGFVVDAESSSGDVIQLSELQADIDGWVSSGLPDPWPSAPANYQRGGTPTFIVYPWYVQ